MGLSFSHDESFHQPGKYCRDNICAFAVFAVIFELIKIKVPKSCGSLEFSSFQKCSKDIGVTKGCCKPGCTAFLKKVSRKYACFFESNALTQFH